MTGNMQHARACLSSSTRSVPSRFASSFWINSNLFRGPVLAQMWQGRAQSSCRCGRSAPSPGADPAGVGPAVPVQMCLGGERTDARAGPLNGCARAIQLGPKAQQQLLELCTHRRVVHAPDHCRDDRVMQAICQHTSRPVPSHRTCWLTRRQPMGGRTIGQRRADRFVVAAQRAQGNGEPGNGITAAAGVAVLYARLAPNAEW